MGHDPPTRDRSHGTLRLLLWLVLLFGIPGTIWLGYRQWYASTHWMEIACASIQPGDSINDLEGYLGPGQLLKRDELPVWLVRNLRRNPQGYQDNDQIFRWKIENWTLYFQFRKGRLINHNPADYADLDWQIRGVQ